MDAVNGSSLDKLGFDNKKAGDVQSPLASDTINGSRDRADLLKQKVFNLPYQNQLITF